MKSSRISRAVGSLAVLAALGGPLAHAEATTSDAPITGAFYSYYLHDSEGSQDYNSAQLPIAAIYEGDWCCGGPGDADVSVTIHPGDGTSVPANLTPYEGRYDVSYGSPHVYAEGGTYRLTLTLKDADGQTTTIQATVVVSDFPLKASPLVIKPNGATVDQALASFTDADPATVASDYAASIDWGDGTVSAGMVVAQAGRFEVLGSHQFGKADSFPVKVTVRDKGGASVAVTDTATISGSGVATLHGIGKRCVSRRRVSATITGQQIQTVTARWRRHRHRVRTVQPGSRYRIILRVGHRTRRLVLRVSFTSASLSAPIVIRRTVRPCAAP